MAALPTYLLPDNAEVGADGNLSIGGVSLVDIARDYGTPAFVYDEAHLEARCREAVDAFGDGVAYATKAFLCKAMAKLAYDAGMRLDVASAGEMHVVLSAGVPADRLVFHGNNKSRAELKMAIEAGIGHLMLDSFDEIDRIEALWNEGVMTTPVQCFVRVTPGVEAHTHEFIMTGQDDSKFGFGLKSGDAQRVVDRLADSEAIELMGVHAHIGSQIFDTLGFEKEVEVLAPFVKQNGIKEFCVGGGLGIPYVDGEPKLSISEWGASMRRAFTEAGLENVKISAEPGRSIAGPAAVTIYEVGTIKDIPGIRTYLSVDGGMSDNPRPILYGSGYEAFLPRNVNAERPKVVTVVGKHCESGDIVVKDAEVPEDVKVGDILSTPVTGAYGHTMASNYNKVTRPPVLFVKDGNVRVVVRRETLDDLTRLDA